MGGARPGGGRPGGGSPGRCSSRPPGRSSPARVCGTRRWRTFPRSRRCASPNPSSRRACLSCRSRIRGPPCSRGTPTRTAPHSSSPLPRAGRLSLAPSPRELPPRMGALTFDALLRSLKHGAPEPVYYLHGEEDVLKDEAVRVLLERAVDPAARDFNVDQRTAADLDPEAFNALVNTPPILAATRAVVLRGMEQLRKTAKVRQELLHYLDSPNPSTVLVLVHGTPEPPDAELLRRATAVEVAALPPERVVRWMTHRAKQLGFTLAPEAGELLLASVGKIGRAHV